MTRRVRPIIVGTLAIPVLVLLIVCVLLAAWVAYLERSHAWVTFTYKAIAETNESFKLLIDQQSGLRAYMLTSDERYLAPYEVGRQRFGDSLSSLARLTSHHRGQQERIAEIDRGYKLWVSSAEEAKRLVGSDAAFPLTRNETVLGTIRSRKDQMDRLRRTFAGFIAEEERLLAEREARLARVNDSLIIGAIGFIVIASVLIVLLVRRQLGRLDDIYSGLLREQEDSAEREKQARTAVEALAADLQSQYTAMEQTLLALREERDQALRRLEASAR